jgi:hypothetical protein
MMMIAVPLHRRVLMVIFDLLNIYISVVPALTVLIVPSMVHVQMET